MLQLVAVVLLLLQWLGLSAFLLPLRFCRWQVQERLVGRGLLERVTRRRRVQGLLL